MKAGKILLVGAFLGVTLNLTGCGDKEIKPSNYYCSFEDLTGQLVQYQKEGRIKDANAFQKECKIQRLGRYSFEYKKVIQDALIEGFNPAQLDNPKKDKPKNTLKVLKQELIAKWKAEEGIKD